MPKKAWNKRFPEIIGHRLFQIFGASTQFFHNLPLFDAGSIVCNRLIFDRGVHSKDKSLNNRGIVGHLGSDLSRYPPNTVRVETVSKVNI